MVNFSLNYTVPSLAGAANEAAAIARMGQINSMVGARNAAKPFLESGEYDKAARAAIGAGDVDFGRQLYHVSEEIPELRAKRMILAQQQLMDRLYTIAKIPEQSGRQAAGEALIRSMANILPPEEYSAWVQQARSMAGDWAPERLAYVITSLDDDLKQAKLSLEQYRAELTRRRDEETARYHGTLAEQRSAELDEARRWHDTQSQYRDQELGIRMRGAELDEARLAQQAEQFDRNLAAENAWRERQADIQNRTLLERSRYHKQYLKSKGAAGGISPQQRISIAMRVYNTEYPMFMGMRDPNAPAFSEWYRTVWPERESEYLGGAGAAQPPKTVNVGGVEYPVVNVDQDGALIVRMPSGETKRVIRRR